MKLPANYKAVIDELGEVERKLESYDKLAKRKKELRAEVSKWAKELKPEGSKTLDGIHYAVAIGPKRLERTIRSMAKVFALLGEKLFLSICSLALKELKDRVEPAEFNRLTVEERTGHREIVTMPRLAERKRAA